MRFTIERIRTLVIVAGALLLVAIAAFLAVGKWKNPFGSRDIPKRLGIDIQQEADGFTYTHANAGHSIFKIHASKEVELKNSHLMLHDVQIELYGADGSRVDRIVGDDFEYDQKGGIATAAGPVEITMMRPGVKPAIASEPMLAQAGSKIARTSPLALTAPSSSQPPAQAAGSGPAQGPAASGVQASPAEVAAKGQIDIKTSGLVFNQQTGIAATSQRVNFSSLQGSGNSMGATYDSQNGLLVLDHSVELTTRGAATGGPSSKPVEMHADHAEIERDSSVCRLHTATAKTETDEVNAADAMIHFRDDGSIAELDASGGFTVETVTGGHLAAPTGTIEFDAKNHPRFGHLEGGVTMDSTSGSRVAHGSSSTMNLEFTVEGDLRHAHLEQAVEVESHETMQSMLNGKPVATELNRTWHSAVADVLFRKGANGHVEPATIHGAGSVAISSESRRGNEKPVPAKLAADEVSGVFGPDSALTSMAGAGHASMEETTANGSLETATGDRLQAQFSSVPQPAAPNQTAAGPTTGPTAGPTAGRGAGNPTPGAAEQIQSAVLDGHVVLVQYPAQQPPPPANPRAGAQPPAPLRATAGRAEYEGTGQWLHLTLNPRVDDGGLQLTADKVDLAQASGNAFAHGNVKATWMSVSPRNNMSTNSGPAGTGAAGAGQSDLALGGKGQAHAIAAEAELHQATQEAIFTGHARLWQETNSVAGPTIVLDREKQVLTAKSTDPAEPVRVVMLSAGQQGAAAPASAAAATGAGARTATPSVIRVHGGDLYYSGIERRAQIHSGALGPVVVETGNVESDSNEAELFLTTAGSGGSNKAPSQPSAAQSQPRATPSQVDRMTASGHVVLTSQGRHGTGEQLAYAASTGDYVLTGTAADPPRMTDPARGTVTGEALIFHSRDDTVNVEGGGQKTMTQTTAPK